MAPHKGARKGRQPPSPALPLEIGGQRDSIRNPSVRMLCPGKCRESRNSNPFLLLLLLLVDSIVTLFVKTMEEQRRR
ncbi:hypothetical protein NL676_029642 [Syzygium grande]|nr:hypothetical protein NL676_029642 [Syzygium grande]